MSFPNCSVFKLVNDYHVPRMDILDDGHYGHLGPDGVRVWRVPLLKQAWKVNRLEPIMKLEVGLFKRRKFSFWNVVMVGHDVFNCIGVYSSLFDYCHRRLCSWNKTHTVVPCHWTKKHVVFAPQYMRDKSTTCWENEPCGYPAGLHQQQRPRRRRLDVDFGGDLLQF